MKPLIAIIALCLTLTAQATTINLDLGPPQELPENGEARLPLNLGITAFQGQHLSFDIIFGPRQFIRLFPTRNRRTFEISPWLSLSGSQAGFIPAPTFSCYTLDQDHHQNSPTQSGDSSLGGGVLADANEPFNYSLGYAFPIFNQNDPFRIYGIHIDTTLPTNSNFTIRSTTLFLGGGGSPRFQIAPVPETGTAAALLGLSLLALAGYRYARL